MSDVITPALIATKELLIRVEGEPGSGRSFFIARVLRPALERAGYSYVVYDDRDRRVAASRGRRDRPAVLVEEGEASEVGAHQALHEVL